MAGQFSVSIVFDGLPEIAASLRPQAAQIVRKTAFDIAADAKVRTPPRVDTGAMLNGWQAQAEEELVWRVSNTQDYALYNEFGTYKMAAHPMLIPAAEQARQPFLDAMSELGNE